MFDKVFDTNQYHTRSAHEIDQRVRQREMQRMQLEAEYGKQSAQEKPRLNLTVVKALASLFAISI